MGFVMTQYYVPQNHNYTEYKVQTLMSKATWFVSLEDVLYTQVYL